jgi:hypothetical protein
VIKTAARRCTTEPDVNRSVKRWKQIARLLYLSPIAEPEFLENTKSFPAETLREQEVSAYINNVKHEGPACLDPPKPQARPRSWGSDSDA